ncbi:MULTISPECIES: TonB-dependent hemoglobin/transferrin/lactoferrin family receptor [Glaesserella]|uniref:TonB-dependent receptor n=1 Tax=Glaesserella australis TaxID=2094024 RepID=A0A328BYU2_9PAST|nr:MULTISPECIES: TonB-dependent hemoglobin/transferrin/lactoferrin family receptor [Glaesserella]AUI66237.1 TonB-dependent receptor [Glaesserella sp. 15-184]RAL19259.1 TonB-dependent receptor [Glaesserella australis]
MSKKTQLAIFVTAICSAYAFANQPTTLEAVEVVGTQERATINKKQIEQQQPKDVKDLLANQLDVQVNDLQRTRSGNDGINIRGLQGNRVASSVDGIPLPETQENKLLTSLGLDFGGANSVEPTSLRSAQVQYGGSYRSLSGAVDFSTLEPTDLIQSGNVGGFVATGYNSVDNSVYGSLAGAAKNDRYEGLVLTTLRFGHETENHASIGGEGATRTKANPADYKNSYVLVKNAYQINEEHKVKLTVEHQQKTQNTELLSGNGVSVDRATGIQTSGFTEDENRRTRVSFGHEYQNEKGWLNGANTQIYFQHAQTENYRQRLSARSNRTESGEVKQQTYGITTNLTSLIESAIPQVLRYGIAHHQAKFSSDMYCNSCSTGLTFDAAATTKQSKTHLYIEDEIALGNVVITPHLGVLHYRSNPSKSGYNQAAEQYAAVESQKETIFLPKFSANWKIAPIFEPYFQYSKGVRTPSAQQLTSSFGNTVAVGGRIIRQYAVIGNPKLKAETGDNFSLGFKGANDKVQYDIAGYYNKYKNFIDWESRATATHNPLIQYQNLDKAKIYGVTANARWNFIEHFYLSGGIAYSKGKSEHNGEKAPINTIQPLKLKAGLGYEGERFGANVQLTHVKAKSDNDINGTIYNPTSTVNLVDLGVYWKPIKNLTLTANVNNLFDKKYWNWADISYFAVQSSSAAAGPSSSSLSATNADTYTAPGRNFNVGLRYEF